MRYSPLSTSVPIRESLIAAASYQTRRARRTPEFGLGLRQNAAAGAGRNGRGSVRAMTARPFPYAALSRVRAADAELLRGVLRALRAADTRANAEAEALLGVRIELQPGPAELLSADEACAALGDTPCGPLLELAAGARAVALPCELPPELAAALVDRVLGGDGRAAWVAGDTLDELSCGVLAYLAARACAASSAPLRVRAPSFTVDEARALFGGGRVLVWPISLLLKGEYAGRLRVFVAEAGARELALHAPGTALRGDVRGVPVTLCAHAARVTLTRRELASLACGDVIVPDHCALDRDARGTYAGAIELHALAHRRVLLHAHGCASQLTIAAAGEHGDQTMTEGKRIETAATPETSALGDDVPLELCLEIARFTLTLGELSALRPGEVLSTGRRIGERVALTIAGRVVAHGELVDVEGDVGMRVLEIAR
jgi:type III secretion system YscQ/HrcQ family protein